MISILGRKKKNNPLLLGLPGVGKTALAWKLAHLINDGEVPDFLHEKIILNLDLAALVAGTGFRGEFEMRLKEILKELEENKKFILFIDEIHNIIGAGNTSGSLDLANILKPALSRSDIQVIGATTQKEFKKHIEKDAALERRFQPIHISEPNQEETKQILEGIKEEYEEFHNVFVSPEALALCVDLSNRYIRDRYQPDKAIDVLDEAAANVRSFSKPSPIEKKLFALSQENRKLVSQKEILIQKEKFGEALDIRKKEKELIEQINFLRSHSPIKEKIVISENDIISTIARTSGIPMEKISRSRDKKISGIFRTLSSAIVGQDEAVQKISDAIIRSQLEISNPDRPLGSFLFLGPSGVGKTYTAKMIARDFFGDTKSLIRFDMSEFMERHSVSALIGSPSGYVGYGEGGRLTEKVRQNPYSLVLFDEIEKAHSDVFNLLLQILEEGVLTDAEGTQVSFKNTIIVLTSNIGTDEFNSVIPGPLGFKNGEEIRKNKTKIIRDNVMTELEDRMRPELINRLDQTIVFNDLSGPDLEKIALKELAGLKERMSKLGYTLEIKPGVEKILAQKSTSKNQGARLVKKNISELVENKIAWMMMEDKIKNNKINIAAKNGKLMIN
jgi:ATP-dependent Clp protease ATP-binding subunit ClpC